MNTWNRGGFEQIGIGKNGSTIFLREDGKHLRGWCVAGYTTPDVPEQVDAIIAGWAEEGRLDVHPDLADEI